MELPLGRPAFPDTLRGPLSEGEAALAGAGPAGGRSMSVGQYLALLLTIGLPFVIVTMALMLCGLGSVALGLGILVLTVLVIWRPELGLFIMAGLFFWQYQTRLSEMFTLVKVVGIVVAVFGLLPSLRSRGPSWPLMMQCAAAFAVWATLSSLYNITTPVYVPLLDLAALLSNILFMYLLMRFCSMPAAFWTLLIVICIGAAGEAILGLVRPAVIQTPGPPTAARLTTAEGININHYVRLMIPGILLPPILLAQTRWVVFKVMLIGCIVVCLVAAILTVSRGAVLGIALGGLVLFLSLRGVPVSTKVLVSVVGILVIAGAVFFAVQMGAGAGWHERMAESSISEAASTRTAFWLTAVRGAMHSPLLGVGPGLEPLEFLRRGFGAAESHNDIASALLTTGIPGMLCFLGVVFAGWFGLWRLPKGIVRSSLLGLWTAVVVAGLFNPTLKNKLLWLPAGICVAGMVCFGWPQPQAPSEPVGGPTPGDRPPVPAQ